MEKPRLGLRMPGRWRSPRWLGMTVLVPVLALAGGSYWLVSGGETTRGANADPAANEAPALLAQEDSTPRVEVVRPTRGGIERKTVQPGSVHAFEWVDLYANVSGYLKVQAVDIGDRVRKGQV